MAQVLLPVAINLVFLDPRSLVPIAFHPHRHITVDPRSPVFTGPLQPLTPSSRSHQSLCVRAVIHYIYGRSPRRRSWLTIPNVIATIQALWRVKSAVKEETNGVHENQHRHRKLLIEQRAPDRRISSIFILIAQFNGFRHFRLLVVSRIRPPHPHCPVRWFSPFSVGSR